MRVKRQYALICVAILALSVVAVYLWADFTVNPPNPKPSHIGGYYDDAFTLTFKVPRNSTVYYTTDGSTPTTASQVYRGGIPINNRTSEENKYNAIANVILDWQHFVAPEDPVGKGTVIRAMCVNDWGYSSDITTQTYFVGIDRPKDALTVSLVFDDDNFFGEDGIYVTGKEYDEWYLSGNTQTEAPLANFQQHLETTALLEILGENGDILNQIVGVRIQGSSKRLWAKKRFILVAREEYGGSKLFEYDLFPGIDTHSVMIKDYLTDAMVASAVDDRAISVQRSIPAQVYLNGEFWYTSYILERYDNQYFKEHYKVNDAIVVKDGIAEEDVLWNGQTYDAFLAYVSKSDFSDPEQWNELLKSVDIQSYIDYITTNYYFCNWDVSENKNYVLWRSTENRQQGYQDARWRWCIYDIDMLEYTLGYFPVKNAAELNIFSCEAPFLPAPLNQGLLFQAFKESEAFRRQFVLSFMDMVNNNFRPEKMETVLKKFGYDLSWQDGYFLKRPTYAPQHLAEEFDLQGTLETVSITSSLPEGGSIVVNTSAVELTDGTWDGKYFTDYPITITAKANSGYRFVGWKGATDTDSHTITVAVDGGVALEAVFVKK